MEKFKVIDCGNYIYISRDHSYDYRIDNFMFDGQAAEPTNEKKWYKLNKIPTEVLKKIPDEQINRRYELKAGYSPTVLMPEIITMDMYNSDEYDDVIGLYTLKYDKKEGGYEPIEFEIATIYEREDFEFVPNKYNAETDLMTQIEYPEIAYQDKPCMVTSEQMFTIIRNYVKKNIDRRYANIDSDYDFHFEVSRQIGLADPYTRMVDINKSWNDKRRKPKWVTKAISTKKVTILNIKPKASNTSYGDDCKLAPEIIGENYIDLEEKVTRYLEDLMASINKNYCECPNCKGWGVVEVEYES